MIVGATEGILVGLTVVGFVLGRNVGDEDVGEDETGCLLGCEVTGLFVGGAVCFMMHWPFLYRVVQIW